MDSRVQLVTFDNFMSMTYFIEESKISEYADQIDLLICKLKEVLASCTCDDLKEKLVKSIYSLENCKVSCEKILAQLSAH